MTWSIGFLAIFGFSFAFWGLVGASRFLVEQIFPVLLKRDVLTGTYVPSSKHRERLKHAKNIVCVDDVAIVVAAHNEELTIGQTLTALNRIIPPDQIHVGCDACSDSTADIVRSYGCHAVEINPNKGKSGVINYLIDQFDLLDRFKVVMIVDADVEPNEHCLTYALPYFDDPGIAAVASHFINHWPNHWEPGWGNLFIAYRVRLYVILQAVMRYGQMWKYTNASSIIPGSAALYRTSALRQIDIAAPGLIIEDFNMTFTIHHKRLGKIAYHPLINAMCENPTTLGDYANQVKRWNLGFWQTVKTHGIWPSFFWLCLGIWIIELTLFGLSILVASILLLWLFMTAFDSAGFYFSVEQKTTLIEFYLAMYAMDYLITMGTAIYVRKPMMLFYGLGFIFLRLLDNVLYLYSIPVAFFVRSDGKWKSPKRTTLR